MIYFRCDGNSVLGGGHVMRCLSIANAFKKEKQDCCFVLADTEFQEKIENSGFKTIVLDTHFNDLESEIKKLLSIIKKDGSILVVDSYFVTYAYLKELKKNIKLVYIDDMFSFAYPVDVLINYNVYASESKYRELYNEYGQAMPFLLLGTSYAPLRREFINLPKKTIHQDITNVLVSTGVSDSLHIALKLITDIKQNGSKFIYHFVIGEKNKDYGLMAEIAQTLNNVRLHYKPVSMSELMEKCDIAISASGTTLYELCAVGIPTISYVLADNQIDMIRTFDKLGLVANLGDARNGGLNLFKIEKTIVGLTNEKKRIELSENMQKVVDGFGSFRIAQILISFI